MADLSTSAEILNGGQDKFLQKSYEKFMNADAYTIEKVKKECEEKRKKLEALIPIIGNMPPTNDMILNNKNPSWGNMAGITKVWGDGGTIGRNPAAVVYMAKYYLGDQIVFDRDAVYFCRQLTGDKQSYYTTIWVRCMTEEGRKQLEDRVATMEPWKAWWATPYQRSWDWKYRGEFHCKMVFNGNQISWEDNVQCPYDRNILTSPGQDLCNLCLSIHTM